MNYNLEMVCILIIITNSINNYATTTEFDDDVHCLTNDEIHLLLLRRQKGGEQHSDTFMQTLAYADTVATTNVEVYNQLVTKTIIININVYKDDLKNLALAISERLNNLDIERKVDRKKVRMHKYEITCLANFGILLSLSLLCNISHYYHYFYLL